MIINLFDLEKELPNKLPDAIEGYYSSGSRPNQTAESWGKARMYAYIFGSPTRKVDYHITKKYKVKFKYKPGYYSYTS